VGWFSFGTDDLGEELATVKAQNTELLRLVRIIMADVKIAQEDLDSTASALTALVTKLNSLDLTPLNAADQSALVSAVADVTNAVNRVTGTSVPDVPTPNPEPEPSETPTDTEPTPDGATDSSE
jgi:phosphopantothenate synthetase